MSSTHITYHINAPRATVWHALTDPKMIAAWRAPNNMTAEVHQFDPQEGGEFRISLTYDDPSKSGKTSSHTDTYHGKFEKIVPNKQVVEVSEFETTDPLLSGKMTLTTTLTDADGGTTVDMVHEGVPTGVAPADNEAGAHVISQAGKDGRAKLSV
jgi:uncharacterized protein YndB with AHSA1/START domain